MSNKTAKIYISGAHSSGKTTLINDLKPHLKDITFEEEIAREIIKKYGWTRDDFLPQTHPENFEKLNRDILKAQIALAIKNDEENRDFLCDRCIDPLAYAKIYLDDDAFENMKKIPGMEEWILKLQGSLIFIIEPHQECIADDSVRLPPSLPELQRFSAELKDIFSQQEIPYICVSMLDREERVKFVLEKIKSHLPHVLK